jgi:hypothetical protein
MRQPTPQSPVSNPQRTRFVLVLAGAAVLCILTLLVVLLVQLLRPQPDLRMRLMPAAAPLSELGQVLITTTGWRREEAVTICLAQPETLACSPDAIVAEQETNREGIVEVTAQVDTLLAQGLTHVIAVGESSGTVSRQLRILQEPVAAARPASSPQPTNTMLPDATPSSAPIVIATATPTVTPTPIQPVADGLWRGEYFANRDLAGAPAIVRSDSALVFDWGAAAPDSALPDDGFSARWTTQKSFLGERYQFTVLVDDGVRIIIDDEVVLDEWHDVAPDTPYVFAMNMTPGEHTLLVEYYDNVGDALLDVTWSVDNSYPEWRGEYFANPDLSDEPILVRNDEALAFDWGSGSPAPGVLPEDGFSARWTRTLPFLAGSYRFEVTADDGVQVFIDGELALDLWSGAGSEPNTIDWPLQEGFHDLIVEYFEDVGDAKISLEWYPAPVVAPEGTPTFPLEDTSPVPTPTATQTTATVRTVTVQPAQGWVGTNLTVTSSGWEPDTLVALALLELLADIDQADDIMEVSADSSGNVTFQLQFPDEPRWRALPQVQIVLHDEEWTTRGAAVFTLTQP